MKTTEVVEDVKMPDLDREADAYREVSRLAARLGLLGLGKRRAGVTKNKARKRNKARAKMARESRRRNRRR